MFSDKMSLRELLSKIKKHEYKSVKVYTLKSEVKFIELRSTLQRKPFFIQLPYDYPPMKHIKADHVLEEVDTSYRTFRQEQYLTKISIPNVACLSEYNICIKNGDHISCYLLDTLEQDTEKDENDLDIDDLIDDNDSDDILIDDYAVQNIYPVFDITFFLQQIDSFEETLIVAYDIIQNTEEELNEGEVTQLLQLFDSQKERVRTLIFDLHKEAFNIRRDITELGEKLSRTYALQKQSIGDKDRVRFRIDRLAIKIEQELDDLNEKLSAKRNEADLLLKEYRKYLDKFNCVCVS